MGCAPSPLPCQPSGVIKIQFPNSRGTFHGSLAPSCPLPRVQEGAEGWIAAGTDSPSVGASPPAAGLSGSLPGRWYRPGLSARHCKWVYSLHRPGAQERGAVRGRRDALPEG